MQKDAKKTLDELAKFLGPWAGLQQIKGETLKLLAEQKDLKKETDALGKSDLKDGNVRDELRKKAEQEDRLANKRRT